MPVSSASCARASRSTSMGFGFFRAVVLSVVSPSFSVRLRGAVCLRVVRGLGASWESRPSRESVDSCESCDSSVFFVFNMATSPFVWP
ncbi:hypothetical protein GCM10018777_04910 [Streptomyces albogriseolus]|nr:hypothetical protein GCM10018777_04910 [Streptomyces viridodiastaticus]